MQLSFHFRDDAEGARGVTAVRDLEIGARAPSVRRLRYVVALRVEYDWNDVPGVASDAAPIFGAEDGIDLGDFRFQLGSMQGCQAAGYDETLSGLLRRSEIDDGIDRLFLRSIDETAGVDDDDVRGGRLANDAVIALSEHSRNPLAVGDVL